MNKNLHDKFGRERVTEQHSKGRGFGRIATWLLVAGTVAGIGLAGTAVDKKQAGELVTYWAAKHAPLTALASQGPEKLTEMALRLGASQHYWLKTDKNAGYVEAIDRISSILTPEQRTDLYERFVSESPVATVLQIPEGDSALIFSDLFAAYRDAEGAERRKLETTLLRLMHFNDSKTLDILFQEEVGSWVDGMTDADLSNMEHDEVADLMGWLVHAEKMARTANNIPLHSELVNRVGRIYEHVGLDPDYLDWMAEKRVAWHDYLSEKSHEMDVFAAAWETATDETRLGLLEHYLSAYIKIHGGEMPDFEVITCEITEDEIAAENGEAATTAKAETKQSKEPGKDCLPEGTAGMQQHVHGGKSIIFMNSDAVTAWDNFEGALSVAIHEARHAFQTHLAHLVETGEIGPDHPAYDQARLFKANAPLYISGKSSYGIYIAQPMERDSRYAQLNLVLKRPGTPPEFVGIASEVPPLTGKSRNRDIEALYPDDPALSGKKK